MNRTQTEQMGLAEVSRWLAQGNLTLKLDEVAGTLSSSYIDRVLYQPCLLCKRNDGPVELEVINVQSEQPLPRRMGDKLN
jgi:hypothetical protein